MRLSRSSALKIFLSTCVSVALVYVVLEEGGVSGVLGILSELNLLLFFAYVSLSLLALLFRALRYRLLVKSIVGVNNLPTFPKFLVLTAIRNAFVDLLPFRLGEVSFFYVASRFRIPVGTAISTFGVCLVLDILVLFTVVCVFLFAQSLFSEVSLSAFGSASTSVFFYAAVLLFLIIFSFKVLSFAPRGLSLAAVGLSKLTTRFGDKVGKYLTLVAGFLSQVSAQLDLIRSNRSLSLVVTFTFLLRIAKYVSLYVLLLSVVSRWNITTDDLPFHVSFLSFIAGEASASLPISGLMGFGAYEGAVSAVLSISKINIPSIVTVVFSVHIVTQIVAYFVGLLAIFTFLIWDLRSNS